MRNINYIAIHCTATQPEASIASIQNYWKNNLGWKNPGYHYIIDRFGNVVNLLPIELVRKRLIFLMLVVLIKAESQKIPEPKRKNNRF